MGVRQLPYALPSQASAATAEKRDNLKRSIGGYSEHIIRTSKRAPLGCLPASIRQALERADKSCGIKVISTYRPRARINGSGRVSRHASCQAADFTTTNPGCVYRVLRGWQGTMSRDYARVRHVHLDNGHWGKKIRFAHYTGRSSRRYAKRYRHRSIRYAVYRPAPHGVTW